MDVRRYYVVTGVGEQGPFRLSELREALASGTFSGSEPVRTGMGTMLGSVDEVLTTPETAWDPAESGSGATAIPFLRSRRLLPLTILVLAFVPALVLLGLLGRGNPPATQTTAKPEVRTVVIPPPPQIVAAPTRPPVPIPMMKPTVMPPGLLPVADPPRAAVVPDLVVRQDGAGVLVIGAEFATIVDNRARIQGKGSPHPYIGSWNDKTGHIAWTVLVTRPGRFQVTLAYACAPTGAGATYHLRIGEVKITGVMQSTTSWDVYESVPLGEVTITQTGELPMTITSGARTGSALMKLRTITLTPVR